MTTVAVLMHCAEVESWKFPVHHYQTTPTRDIEKQLTERNTGNMVHLNICMFVYIVYTCIHHCSAI